MKRKTKQISRIVLIRHAESDIRVREDRERPLTEKGRQDAARLPDFLADFGIAHIASSPYRRAMDTVRPLAENLGLAIETVPDMRERAVGGWVEDFAGFSRRQWEDFSFRREGGESLTDTRERSVSALEQLLERWKGSCLAVGIHGTALCVLLNHYDKTVTYPFFLSIIDRMPWLVEMTFDNGAFAGWRSLDFQCPE